jgi:hypothetical protein
MQLYRIFKNDPRVGHATGVVPATSRKPFEGQIIAAVQAFDGAARQWAVMPADVSDCVYFATLDELV